MAVNCFMCCLTSLQRAGSVRRSASRNFGVLHSTASVQNRDESASRSASPPRAAASTRLRAALASGVPLAGEECLVRLVLCGGGVLGGRSSFSERGCVCVCVCEREVCLVCVGWRVAALRVVLCLFGSRVCPVRG